ncbi:nucleotidyl transferase AbiEii/AbiGii toxin family protein [Occultella kanbiaonis]|uniref:nucleotidyl transferase AbiEii/AbiGii toxin family protein n=1 Tax=Occultella kanbiaonis TaxID=2675754 RepID=UPI0013D63802|nr:nucleotidyl transferase AbiEii/AbiGii toxin family protein [Occultella kanbiaonis]
MNYASWTATAKAIKAVAARNATAGGPAIDAQIRSAHFDRFLSRVFADQENAAWLLKGGTGLLARVPQARATKDVDVAAPDTGSLDEAVEALQECVARDLGDHLRFELTSQTETGLADNQPGVRTRRLTFTCYDVQTQRVVGQVPVDLVLTHAPVGPVEVRDPANRINLPRDLPAYPYRLFPIADQVADKVCATVSTKYPGGRRSTRVKDLLDLVVIAQTQRIDLNDLRAAIATKRVLSKLPPFTEFTTPPDWEKRYRDLAVQIRLTDELATLDAARDLVAQMVTPALTTTVAHPAQTWVPGDGWLESAEAAVRDEAGTVASTFDGTQLVRSHRRTGGSVRAYRRTRRGT